MKTVLILMAFYGGAASQTTQVEFANLAACEAAKTAIYNQYMAIDQWHITYFASAKTIQGLAVSGPVRAPYPMVYCIEQG